MGRTVLIALVALATTCSAARAAPVVERVDVRTDGSAPMRLADANAVSGNGRFVAFKSWAGTLVPGDSNHIIDDVFVRDRKARTTELVSLGPDGRHGDGPSTDPAISGSGRFVAFMSSAPAFLPDMLPNFGIFVRDRRKATTEQVSVASDGMPANGVSENPSISASGRYVAFRSTSSNFVPVSGLHWRVFVHDRVTGDTSLVPTVAGEADEPVISGDGQVVAYIVEHAVYAHDRRTGTSTRVDVNNRGRRANRRSSSPVISADGRFVAFISMAHNLAGRDRNPGSDLFVRDLALGTTRLASVPPARSPWRRCRSRSACVDKPGISADGRFVAFSVASRSGGAFWRDMRRARSVRQSYGRDGKPLDAYWTSISPDGRFVTFATFEGLLISRARRGP